MSYLFTPESLGTLSEVSTVDTAWTEEFVLPPPPPPTSVSSSHFTEIYDEWLVNREGSGLEQSPNMLGLRPSLKLTSPMPLCGAEDSVKLAKARMAMNTGKSASDTSELSAVQSSPLRTRGTGSSRDLWPLESMCGKK